MSAKIPEYNQVSEVNALQHRGRNLGSNNVREVEKNASRRLALVLLPIEPTGIENMLDKSLGTPHHRISGTRPPDGILYHASNVRHPGLVMGHKPLVELLANTLLN